MTSFPDTAPPGVTVALQAIAAKVFASSPTARSKAANAGQVADYIDWQERTFGQRPPLYRKREKLWGKLIERLDSRPLVAFEFGVAYGYATNWWLSTLRERDVSWHGFDRFTGLPRAWREHDEGAFDNGGRPPAITDERAMWHVGDVENTLPALDLGLVRDAQWLIFFDLDLYEPTAFAWKLISPHLRSGDLIYLDEAYDHDERRVLDEMILPSVECEPVGATAASLGLVVN